MTAADDPGPDGGRGVAARIVFDPSVATVSEEATAVRIANKARINVTGTLSTQSAITEAERGPSSSIISPKYSPGPCVSNTTSRPSASAANTFTRPATMM